jgi:hypothetical protein
VNIPAAVGVPLIVITLLDQFAVTPDGKPEPVRLPMPVALVVVCVIFGVNAVLTVSVGVVDAVLTEQAGVALTVILPVAFTLPHPPVRGIS